MPPGMGGSLSARLTAFIPFAGITQIRFNGSVTAATLSARGYGLPELLSIE